MAQHVVLVGRGGGYATFAELSVTRMAKMLPNQSKDSVSRTLGISSNTWLKIKRGQPIRASTAMHLARRLETIQGHSAVDGRGGYARAEDHR